MRGSTVKVINALQHAREVGPALRKTPVIAPVVKPHTGPIHSHVAGRTDHLPMHVRSGSYVLPADIISGMGEGNTLAGFKVAKSIFTAPSYVASAGSLPYGMPSPGGQHRAAGGATQQHEELVPIVAAGGEYVISPEDVMWLGDGNLDDGHKILDEYVKQYRDQLVHTLSNLPGPAQN